MTVPRRSPPLAVMAVLVGALTLVGAAAWLALHERTPERAAPADRPPPELPAAAPPTAPAAARVELAPPIEESSAAPDHEAGPPLTAAMKQTLARRLARGDDAAYEELAPDLATKVRAALAPTDQALAETTRDALAAANEAIDRKLAARDFTPHRNGAPSPVRAEVVLTVTRDRGPPGQPELVDVVLKKGDAPAFESAHARRLALEEERATAVLDVLNARGK